METFIRIVLQNFTLTFLVLGLIATGISLWRRPRPLTPSLVVEDVFSYFLLFSVGMSFFYNFVVHVFFGDTAAKFIGWGPSPFQAEVGMASLGYSIVGLLAFRGDFGLRVAAVIGPAIFLLGAAAGHVHQMIVAHNFAPGNAGVIFYTDIAIPIIGLAPLWLQHRFDRESFVPRSVSGEVVTLKEASGRKA
ncbi:MAG: hypothetical protein HY574_08455 [candidate division NC10 bacterium]|nr:hypothetical protein [candidate division NC10 bacterium]